MPNKTIYVSEKDASLFEKAQKIAGVTLSSVIARALTEYVSRHEKKGKNMQEITIKVGSHTSEREQKFIGRELGKWSGMSDDTIWWLEARIYLTQKGNCAVYVKTVSKATVLTNPHEWRKSGDYLINVQRGELFVTDNPDKLEKKLPKALFLSLKELLEKEEQPVEYLDI